MALCFETKIVCVKLNTASPGVWKRKM